MGFSLLELSVALTIAAVVSLLAATIFSRATDAARRLDLAGATLTREMNARRWLATAFRSLEIDTDSGESFDGGAHRMRFTAWLTTGDGWFERSGIELLVRDTALVVNHGPGPFVLLPGVEWARFDYLTERGENAPWLASWQSAVVPPLAVRLRLARRVGSRFGIDTLMFVVGERG